MLRILAEWGHEATVVSPEGSRTIPAPSEPDLRLCLQPGRQLRRVLGDRVPDALHIATEGPLGLAARKMALARGWRFTTSFHTMFPDYLQARMGIPAALPWRYLRWFHRPRSACWCPRPRCATSWSSAAWATCRSGRAGGPRQVPAGREPGSGSAPSGVPQRGPGRAGKEPGRLPVAGPAGQQVVGGGPDEARLKKKFPDAVFLGMRNDDELPGYYQAADVFVFPSLTDTFRPGDAGGHGLRHAGGGVPQRAPLAVVQPGVTGCLDESWRTPAARRCRWTGMPCGARADAQLGRHRVRPAGGAGAADAAGRTGPAAGACGLIRAVGRIRGRMRSGLAALSARRPNRYNARRS